MMLLSVFVKQRCLVTRLGTVNLAFNRSFKSLIVPLQDISLTATFPLEKPWNINRKVACVSWKAFSTTRKCFLSKDDYQVGNPRVQAKDKVPSHYEMVYESDISLYFMMAGFGWLAMFMFLSSVVVVLTTIFQYEVPKSLFIGDTEIIKTSYAVYPIVIGTLLCLMVPIVRLQSRLVKRMYYDKTTGEFIGILPKTLFKTESVSFKFEEAVGITEAGKTGNTYSNFRVKGKKCHVYEKDFARFKHLHFYNKWFGYDEEPISENDADKFR